MRILDVVNEMLGTMGQLPLNSVTQSHPYLAPALAALDDKNRQIQAIGHYYNTETLRGLPDAVDGRILLSPDILEIRSETRNLAQRAGRLYDLDKGDDVFTEPVDMKIVRLIPFEDLPELPAQHIASAAVLAFQRSYDGDRAKTEDLTRETRESRAEMRAQHIRAMRANLLDINPFISRVRWLNKSVR